jgi:hypothetical protein
MAFFGDDADWVRSRALVLSCLLPTGSAVFVTVHVMTELPGGGWGWSERVWDLDQFSEAVRAGRWVPVKLQPEHPDQVELLEDLVPTNETLTRAVAEALGAPAALPPVAPDPWRVGIAVAWAQGLALGGGLRPEQVAAIVARMQRGV